MFSVGKYSSFLYATLAITFWGISFVSTKFVLQEIHPFTLIATRFAIGSLFLLLLLLLLREKISVRLSHLPHLIGLATIGVFIHQMIQVIALQTTDATSAGWLITLSPIFTVILSILFLGETFRFLKGVGMGIAIFGVLLLTSKGDFTSFGGLATWGNLLMIASTLNWAIYSFLLKKLNLPYSSLTVTFYTSTIGFLMTFGFFLQNNGWNELKQVSIEGWYHLLFLGILVSAVGYWLWGMALEVLDATQVAVFLYLEPLATLLAAKILLQEALQVTTVLGGVMIVLGVAVVNGQLKLRFAKG